jgi:hypothetical protein
MEIFIKKPKWYLCIKNVIIIKEIKSIPLDNKNEYLLVLLIH